VSGPQIPPGATGESGTAPEITVVLPAHNEAELLEQAVTEVVEGLRSRGRHFEVVVVENGSSDDTATIARRLEARIPELRAYSMGEPNYGKALRAGLLAARGDVVVNFDVDFCDLGFLDRAVPMVAVAGGPAVVVGSKRSEGADDTRALGRRMVTNVFSTVLRFGFGLSVSDTHGVKALDRAALAPIAEGCRFGEDLFDTELILRAERAGLGSAEIPVKVVELRPARSPVWKRVPRTLTSLGRLRLALWREAAIGARKRKAGA
jgi:hypothetical protein